MSTAVVIPKNQNATLLLVIGLLISGIAFGIPMVIKMMDQKDESIRETRSNYEDRIRELNEKHKGKVDELNKEISFKEEELKTANINFHETEALYNGAQKSADELQKSLEAIRASGGINIDSTIALARLRGELKQYETELGTAKSQIVSLENSIKSLEADLLAAEQKITELRDSLAIAKDQWREEVKNQKDIGENSIKNLDLADKQEDWGDALPSRKRFIEEKFGYYQNARALLIEVQQSFDNSTLLSERITRINSKMEELRPGSTIEPETRKGF